MLRVDFDRCVEGPMSDYGPAVFVSRRDGADLSEQEQATVLQLVCSACRTLDLTDDDDEPVKPSVYCYDEEGYEAGALGILLYSSGLYGALPEEIQADEEQSWEETGARIAAEIEKQRPGRYAFVCYGVED